MYLIKYMLLKNVYHINVAPCEQSICFSLKNIYPRAANRYRRNLFYPFRSKIIRKIIRNLVILFLNIEYN